MVKGRTLLFTENDGTFLFSYFCVIYVKIQQKSTMAAMKHLEVKLVCVCNKNSFSKFICGIRICI